MPEFTISASSRARARRSGTLRQERRLRDDLVQVLEDGHRLREAERAVSASRARAPGPAPSGFSRANSATILFASVPKQVHEHELVRDALVLEPDAHAPRRRASPIAREPHGATTVCSMAPKMLRPAPSKASIVTVIAGFQVGGHGLRRDRSSPAHAVPRDTKRRAAGSRFDTVPLPRIVPAVNERVFAMCSTRSQNEKCISGPGFDVADDARR